MTGVLIYIDIAQREPASIPVETELEEVILHLESMYLDLSFLSQILMSYEVSSAAQMSLKLIEATRTSLQYPGMKFPPMALLSMEDRGTTTIIQMAGQLLFITMGFTTTQRITRKIISTRIITHGIIAWKPAKGTITTRSTRYPMASRLKCMYLSLLSICPC